MIAVAWSKPKHVPLPDADVMSIPLRKIISEVCAKHKISRREMLSNRRMKYVVKARHEAFWRCKNETYASYPEIGKVFNKDHTTIMHGVRRFEAFMKANNVGAIPENFSVLAPRYPHDSQIALNR